MVTHGRRENAFSAPTRLESFVHRASRPSQFTRPFGDRQSTPMIREPMIVFPIVGLNGRRFHLRSWHCREDSFDAPTVAQSTLEHGDRPAEFSTPFSDGQCTAIVSQPTVVASVVAGKRAAFPRISGQRGCREDSVNRPVQFQSVFNDVTPDAEFSHPLHNRLRASVPRQSVIRPFVIALLTACGPHAVITAIAARIVATFKCVLRRWSGLHFVGEYREVKPARVFYADAAAAVIFPIFVAGIGATIDHVTPYFVLGCL